MEAEVCTGCGHPAEPIERPRRGVTEAGEEIVLHRECAGRDSDPLPRLKLAPGEEPACPLKGCRDPLQPMAEGTDGEGCEVTWHHCPGCRRTIRVEWQIERGLFALMEAADGR